MFILYGWDSVIKKEKLLGKKKCENCENISDMYLARTIFRVKLFFISVLWWTTKRFIMCSDCGMIKHLEKEEYEQIKKDHGMIYNNSQTMQKSFERITSWHDEKIESNSELNYEGSVKQTIGDNTPKVGWILLKIFITPILTFILWFIYLCIVAMFIPAEAEITDAQGWTSGLLGLITALIIVSKIKPNKK